MSVANYYLKQVELLVKILPLINRQKCFALKGGTAINLFYTNMPRLSVDIDLTYLPVEPREIFLPNIAQALQSLKTDIQQEFPCKVRSICANGTDRVIRLLVHDHDIAIKIEPNFVFRGSVFGTSEPTLCDAAQTRFLRSFKIRALSREDVYGGKIHAALSRQHPRDLFDIKVLFDETGITEKIRKAFVIYLASSSRPMNEILSPNINKQDIERSFADGFHGMTEHNPSIDELIEILIKLQKTIVADFTGNEREFLLSVKQGALKWNLLQIDGLQYFPSITWKAQNVLKMEEAKRVVAEKKLRDILGI